MSDKYILEGKIPVPCGDLMTWAQWFETADRHVANDIIGKSTISTVFLGLNHAFGRGRLLLFETMIFDGKHDGYQDRYTTWEEAEIGHQRAVRLVESEAESHA